MRFNRLGGSNNQTDSEPWATETSATCRRAPYCTTIPYQSCLSSYCCCCCRLCFRRLLASSACTTLTARAIVQALVHKRITVVAKQMPALPTSQHYACLLLRSCWQACTAAAAAAHEGLQAAIAVQASLPTRSTIDPTAIIISCCCICVSWFVPGYSVAAVATAAAATVCCCCCQLQQRLLCHLLEGRHREEVVVRARQVG
jgi:hypothetical protein